MAGPSESFPAAFCLPVLDLLPVQAIRIAENSRCLLEWDAVLLVVLQGLTSLCENYGEGKAIRAARVSKRSNTAQNSPCGCDRSLTVAALMVFPQTLTGVPREHISVYTLIGCRCQTARCSAEANDRSGFD